MEKFPGVVFILMGEPRQGQRFAPRVFLFLRFTDEPCAYNGGKLTLTITDLRQIWIETSLFGVGVVGDVNTSQFHRAALSSPPSPPPPPPTKTTKTTKNYINKLKSIRKLLKKSTKYHCNLQKKPLKQLRKIIKKKMLGKNHKIAQQLDGPRLKIHKIVSSWPDPR